MKSPRTGSPTATATPPERRGWCSRVGRCGAGRCGRVDSGRIRREESGVGGVGVEVLRRGGVPGHLRHRLAAGPTQRSVQPVGFQSRVGAQFRVFENDAGIDVVRAMHLDLSGRPIPSGNQIEGERFVVEPWDAASLLANPHQPWTGGVGRPRVAWWANDDPHRYSGPDCVRPPDRCERGYHCRASTERRCRNTEGCAPLERLAE